MKKVIFLILLISNWLHVQAHDNISISKEDEERSREIFVVIRCTTCKGQSIKESDTEIANLLRNSIRQQVKEGRTSQQIINFIEEHYGEHLIMKPKISLKTYILWLLPLLLLIIWIMTMTKNIKIKY